MGAWADMEVDADLVKGLAEQLFISRAAGQFAKAEITDERTKAAKRLAQRKMLDPKVSKDFGKLVSSYDGVPALLDAVAGAPELSGSVGEMLAHAFIFVRAKGGRNTRDDLYGAFAEDAEDALDSSIRALGQHAGFVLKKTPTTGRSSGGAFASTYSTWDE